MAQIQTAAIDLSERCSNHSDDLFLDSADTILFSPSAVNLPSSPDIGSDILLSPLSLPSNSTASSPLSTSLPRHCGTYPKHSTPFSKVSSITGQGPNQTQTRLTEEFGAWSYELIKNTQTSLQESPLSLLGSFCCENRCLAHISVIEIQNVQQIFDSKSTVQQNQFLLDSFHITSKATNDVAQAHTIDGKPVCKEAFRRILKISMKRYKRLFDQYNSGVTISSRKKPARELSVRTTEAKAWMTQFFSHTRDRMPHLQQIHLPHFLTKRDVYNRMCKELNEQAIPHEAVVANLIFMLCGRATSSMLSFLRWVELTL